MKLAPSLLRLLAMAAIGFAGCSKQATVLEVSPEWIPYTKSVTMNNGDAFYLRMPNGDGLAFWCHTQDFPVAEQTTNSGLDISWGESPFRHSPVVYAQDPKLNGAATHILFEGVTTSTKAKVSKSSFVISTWRIVLTEDIAALNGLPVKITVESIAESGKRTHAR